MHAHFTHSNMYGSCCGQIRYNSIQKFFVHLIFGREGERERKKINRQKSKNTNNND